MEDRNEEQKEAKGNDGKHINIRWQISIQIFQ